jgi:hypothetical protein
MPATFDETLMNARDRARALLGDTAVTPGTTTIPDEAALFSDAHITAVLALYTPFETGVAFLAEELVTRFAQAPVKLSGGGESVDFSARIPAWQALAERMRARVAATVEASAKVAVGFSLRGKPRPDYTLPGGDIVEETYGA